MLNELYRIIDYLEYLITSDTRHGIHSPFVYRLTDEVILNRSRNAMFEAIEQVRKDMIKSRVQIQYEDLGGGNRSGKRSLSEIASRTARGAKYGQLLYRLLAAFQPEYNIELGTGTGITALYQAAALSPDRPLHTVEGSGKLSEIARFNAENLELQDRLIFHTGAFDNVLPQLLASMPRLDYAYIDGNHRLQPTLDYFEAMLPHCHNNSMLVFDDIYWSNDMKRAWSNIKSHPSVTVTLDLFAFGIVFFRREQPKEHFKIRY